MRECLTNIQKSSCARLFILEGGSRYPEMTACRRNSAAHQIEVDAEKLWSLMPWMRQILDKDKN